MAEMERYQSEMEGAAIAGLTAGGIGAVVCGKLFKNIAIAGACLAAGLVVGLPSGAVTITNQAEMDALLARQQTEVDFLVYQTYFAAQENKQRSSPEAKLLVEYLALEGTTVDFISSEIVKLVDSGALCDAAGQPSATLDTIAELIPAK